MKNVKNKSNETNELKGIKYIIFAILAIVIVVIVVIFLIKGCKKEEIEKPNVNPVKVPVITPSDTKEEDTQIKQQAINQIKKSTKKVIAQVSRVTKQKNYTVIYNLDTGGTKTIEVKPGEKINSKFIPTGYSSCTYYSDSNFKDKFNFNNPINENTKIYMQCEAENYNIIYFNGNNSDNINSYSINDVDFQLKEALPDPNKTFLGWYLDSNFSKEIKTITNDIIKYADSNNTIKIYAKFDSVIIEYYNAFGGKITESPISNSRSEKALVPPVGVCDTNDKFLGWSTQSNGSVISYIENEEIVDINSSFKLYAMCGKATIIYESEGQVVKVGYKEDDLNKYELPEVDEVGLDVPTYYIKIDDMTETSKKIISDDSLETLENEIKLEDAKSKASSSYTPEVGDNIEEKEKVFDGYEMIKEDNSTTPPTINNVPVDDPETVKTEINEQEQESPAEVPEVKLTAQWKEQEEDQNNKSNSNTTNTQNNTSQTNTNTNTNTNDDDKNNTNPTNA